MDARFKLKIEWIEASNLEEEAKEQTPELHAASWEKLKAADGVLVPGGFGNRGVEGKILAANYARVNKVPYLGICLGMQIAVIEFARNVLGKEGANSTEFDPSTRNPVVVFMPEGSTTHKASGAYKEPFLSLPACFLTPTEPVHSGRHDAPRLQADVAADGELHRGQAVSTGDVHRRTSQTQARGSFFHLANVPLLIPSVS